ncbi:hypothetical protein MMC14_006427 [Varicellaria rhodocarpa]|nr:hypothetical protein [Varicellaria rhodocarpa]
MKQHEKQEAYAHRFQKDICKAVIAVFKEGDKKNVSRQDINVELEKQGHERSTIDTTQKTIIARKTIRYWMKHSENIRIEEQQVILDDDWWERGMRPNPLTEEDSLEFSDFDGMK